MTIFPVEPLEHVQTGKTEDKYSVRLALCNLHLGKVYFFVGYSIYMIFMEMLPHNLISMMKIKNE